ncbi:DUF5020 family protein [Ketobacter sp.]|uniref:DUF5020 family protein n=1 Tax=Ketobacter sp. TaxID=2083498 RepID=UPI000F155E29|nr:DUF5020 family protein [Ketobacter sp.]RLT92081.1 MAG: DUF5020 family protein [Ketobacter sp.]
MLKQSLAAAGGALVLASGLISANAQAEMIWSTFSLSYLKGDHYKVGDNEREVLTVEHASGHDWGDNFFFIDHSTFADGVVTNYGELSPRLSFSYLTRQDLSFSFVKDVFIASTWEMGDVFNNYLYGIGFALDVPGFQYFGVNFYKANNDLWDDDEQVTLTWGLPFSLGGAEFLYDGFLDYSTESDTNAKEMNFTSQLKWNVGKLVNSKAPFYLGIEYAYWNNKYGIDGVDERNPNLLVKWHF